MANSLAVEWAKDRIRVNTLSPGYMATVRSRWLWLDFQLNCPYHVQSLTRTILDNNPALRETWESRTPMVSLHIQLGNTLSYRT